MLLCEFKGADAAEAFKNIPIYIVAPLVAMAVTYFCVVIKGVKESKANFVLIPAILMAVFYVWALVGSDQSNNNFFDWLSYIIGFIQVGILYRVYMLIKTAR
jgi:cytochrome bd-type quinol oxidase subunit 2